MTNTTDFLHDVLLQGRLMWIPGIGAFLCLLIDALWPKKLTVVVYLLGILSLGFSMFIAMQDWSRLVDAAPLSSIFIFNRLSLFFVILILVAAIFTLLNALGYLGQQQRQASELVALVLFSVLGMMVFVVSDHLILSFIGLEIFSLSIYVLVGSQKKSLKSNEAAIKYFIMGGVASAILLYGIVFFYGSFQTFRLSELAFKVIPDSLSYLKNLAVGLMLVGLFFKIAIVPFHFWVPDVYQGAPSPVTGFMATAVKISVFGFLIKFLDELSLFEVKNLQILLSVLMVMTLVVGNFLAILQDDVKRMLAYSSISHSGFLLLGICAGYIGGSYALVTVDAVLFYLLGYVMMSLGAFAILSLMVREKHDATGLGDFAGLAKTHPVLAAVFSLFLLALMGLPGTVGFVAKYKMVELALLNGHLNLAILAMVLSVVSAFYYLKPIAWMYFKDSFGQKPMIHNPESVFLYVTIVFCVVAVLALGFRPDLYLPFARLTLLP